jgi:hypothetical protein
MVLPSAPKRLPRGLRLHNPGNVRIVKGVRWQGEAPTQRDREFVTFADAKWGIRALVRCLITYFDKRYAKDGSKIDCIADVIERWAPPNENNTQAYIQAVAKSMRVDPKQELDLYDFNTMKNLVIAIIRHENGQMPYSDAEIHAGLIAAGLQLPQSRMGLTAEVGAVGVGSIGILVTTINEAIEASRLTGAKAGELVATVGFLPEWVGPLVSIPAAIAVLVLALRLAHRQRLLGA